MRDDFVGRSMSVCTRERDRAGLWRQFEVLVQHSRTDEGRRGWVGMYASELEDEGDRWWLWEQWFVFLCMLTG